LENQYNSILILGPTASGKTRLAAHLAHQLKGAVLSFDSRQVYRQLTIGAGKDLDEFKIEGESVPHYLIDICDVNENFHSYAFVKKYIEAFEDCISNKQMPILCGGTGLYFDLALKKHQYINIPNNPELRKDILLFSDEALIEKLKTFPTQFTAHADMSTRKRTIRAIEIADYLSHNVHEKILYPDMRPIIFGLNLSSTERKLRINQRLEQRINHGLIEEVQHLLKSGVTSERLIFLGLEYKYITEYLEGKHDKETMINLLKTAIHQYSKRQMTWFRKMEREGNKIHWIDGKLTVEEQLEIIIHKIKPHHLFSHTD
jgi:tRNA dimethylallyltransferase